jgi:myo-inositol 2-dehydrogenase / D-chiro-inositol 1-dehydrogenase
MEAKSNITRRDFLQKGALMTTSPLILNFVDASAAQKINRLLNIAVIGLGGRGQEAHINTLLKFPDVKIAAICDIKEERIKETLERAKGHNPKVYTNYHDLLRHKDLDCVFVSTPPDRHKVMVCDALHAGLSVYVDKPMCITVTDCHAIGRAVENAKGVFIVGHQLRYNPSLRKKVEAVQNDVIGKVALIDYKVFRGPGRGPDMTPLTEAPDNQWILSIEEGGDIILEQGVHWIDVINWIMGTHPIRAVGLGGQGVLFDETYDNETLDHYAVLYEYPGNRRAFFSHSWMSMPGSDPNAQTVHGTGGALDLGSGKLFLRGRKEEAKILEGSELEGDMDYLCVQEFLECHTTKGKKPFNDFEVGNLAALSALLGRKAIYEQRAVTWEELLREGAPIQRVDQYNGRGTSSKQPH